ncbi:unnamed protein product [Cylicocyclus nassatus]|uniref:CCHC-type domain-containing protein n=1 Tax=Cylicocyclus nassatus TaxID=53992 RepID=A0AA36GYH7_CYLNA|nr:unnamed protein product [Cylicocyclus nassatus]
MANTTTGDQNPNPSSNPALNMDQTHLLMLQIMELRNEVKKKQGSSEDYVMNALATRLPEFDQNPNPSPNTDTIHFLMKQIMDLWKSCREPMAELTKQESNEEYKDYLELQNHIQMIDKAKVPQVSVNQMNENPQVNAMQRDEKREPFSSHKPRAHLCMNCGAKTHRTRKCEKPITECNYCKKRGHLESPNHSLAIRIALALTSAMVMSI